MKRLIFIITTLLVTVDYSYGCLSATQNRIFPIGKTSKGLLVMEAKLGRSGYQENENSKYKPVWSGTCYLKVYSSDYKTIYSTEIDQINKVKLKHFDSIVGNVFKEALKACETAKTHFEFEFKEAEPIDLSFCNYRDSCNKARLAYDRKQKEVAIRLANRDTHPIKPINDSLLMASDVLNYYGGYDSLKSLKENVYINSVRKFNIGSEKLIIVHIARGYHRGQFLESAGYKHTMTYNQNDFGFNRLGQSVFLEPALHHGHGFDFAFFK